MSLEALNWALRQEVFQSSHKFVLIVLGNYAGDRGISYPSVQTICSATSLTKDTVRSALNALVADKLIDDTGKKAGATQQIRVFRFPEEAWSPGEKGTSGSPLKGTRKGRERDEKGTNPQESPNIQGTGTGTGTIVRAKAPPTPAFVPPELTECIQYGTEIGISADESEAFRDRFMSNGWKVGGRAPMRDWKAAMRTWKRNAHQFSNGKPDVRPNYERTEREGKF